MAESKINSPCISRCDVNATGVCMACCRRTEEIMKWYSFHDEKKQDILDEIPNRKEKLNASRKDIS